MDSLQFLAEYTKDVKTPAGLLKAITDLGPLPRYFKAAAAEGHVNVIPGPAAYDVEDKEAAFENARRCYLFARQKAIDLRRDNPSLPPVPPPQADPFLGLQGIQEWCIEAMTPDAAANTTAKPVDRPTPVGEEAAIWSRSMTYTDMADRLFKNPRKWRTVKKQYAALLREAGSRQLHQIRIDGFDKDVQGAFAKA